MKEHTPAPPQKLEIGFGVVGVVAIAISRVEIETFKAGHESMQGGFGGMYDVYDSYLESLAKTA